jgi:hypothetical protein
MGYMSVCYVPRAQQVVQAIGGNLTTISDLQF